MSPATPTVAVTAASGVMAAVVGSMVSRELVTRSSATRFPSLRQTRPLMSLGSLRGATFVTEPVARFMEKRNSEPLLAIEVAPYATPLGEIAKPPSPREAFNNDATGVAAAVVGLIRYSSENCPT